MGLKVSDAWRLARGKQRLLEDIPVEEVDVVLCTFFVEARKQDGEDYELDSLVVMQASLYRHLKNLGRPTGCYIMIILIQW